MQLNGIEFGRVFNASGARGFFGETNRFQWQNEQPEPDWTGSSFVAKTTTLLSRAGNMPFKSDGLTAQESQPRCMVVRADQQIVLNSVGLSGPGCKQLLNDGRFQARQEPFSLSFMSVAASMEERLQELNQFIQILGPALANFQAPVALQINFSCPNVGLHFKELEAEVTQSLDQAAGLNIPLIPKFNLLFPQQSIRKISQHPACSALCVTNTIPWGQRPEAINWTALFGQTTSPLADLGGGGLSGAPLLPLLLEWLRQSDLEKPVLAGGGILSLVDAERVFQAGAAAISLGVISILQPQEVKKITSTYA